MINIKSVHCLYSNFSTKVCSNFIFFLLCELPACRRFPVTWRGGRLFLPYDLCGMGGPTSNRATVGTTSGRNKLAKMAKSD
jgi:hypothetical protein